MNVLSSGVMVMNETDKGAIFWNHKLQHKWKIFNKQLNSYVELWLTLREYTESIKGEFKKETHLFWLPVHLFPNKVTVVQLLSCVWLFATSWTCSTRLPCPSPSPGVCSNSCPLSHWCHPNISSSVTRFSSCLQSFPAPGSFPVSQLFTSGGQSIGASASASVLQWIFRTDFL